MWLCFQQPFVGRSVAWRDKERLRRRLFNVRTLVLLSCVSCYRGHARKHVCKFPFISLSRFVLTNVLTSQLTTISGLDDERSVYLHSVGEKASAEWGTCFTVGPQSFAKRYPLI